MKYIVEFSKTAYYAVEIEAKTLEEAKDLALDELEDDSYCYKESEESFVFLAHTVRED